MTHMTQNGLRKLGALAFAGCILMGASPAQAWDNDDDYRHGKSSRPTHFNGPECRDIVKKIKVGRSVTYTERGTACRDHYGAWNITTNTRYPNYEAQVYFNERGKLIFLGSLYPSRDYGYYDRANYSTYKRPVPVNCHNNHNHYSHDNYDKPKHNYKDKNNHKKH